MPRAADLLASADPRGGVPFVSAGVRAALAHVFGPPPFDPEAYPGDPGLLGPDSASWRIIGDPAAIIGGIRALLVQLLHPLAMAGVADHSRFRDDALGRLRSTSAYVVTSTFGAMPEVLGIARRVRGRHSTVAGAAPDGRTYAAADPHLLVWVSIALTSSFLAAHRAYAPRISPAAEDAFVAEQARIAALLDPRVDLGEFDTMAAGERAARADTLPLIAEGLLPRTVAELTATLAAYEPELEVNDQGRAAVRFLLWPDIGPLRAGYLPVLAGAVATLPAHQRRMLGLRVPRAVAAATRAQTRASVAATRLAVGSSPARGVASARVGKEGNQA